MSDEKNDSRPEDAEPPAETKTAMGEEIKSKAVRDGDDATKSVWGMGGKAAEIEALQAETAELKDRLLRTVAEMENVRRRMERDKSETAKYAISNFARDVLSVGDNIRRAIEAVPDDAATSDSALKSLLDGVEMTERELLNVLERHGIARVEPKGERFDPNQHQAMFEIENEDVPAGTILEVMQAGYIIADRVLRPAMVGVSKGGEKLPKPVPEPEAEAEAKAEEVEVEPEAPQAANDDAPEAEAVPEAEPDETKDETADDKAKPEGKKKKGGGKVGRRVDKSA